MHVEDHAWESPAIGHGMPLRLYGHDGRPIVAFPPQDGRHLDFEGFGMIEALAPLIEAGRLRIVAVDSIDHESWTNEGLSPGDRARRHGAYDRYLVDEVVPWVGAVTGRSTLWATGCSMGGYHAANVAFRHPDLFDGVVAISGLYQLRHFIGDAMDDAVYLQSPLHYLPNLDDPWYLDRLRKASLCFVCGQGAWEEEMLEDTRALGAILEAKAIPAIVDIWGYDVNHDWPWWRRMLPYELERMGV
jgi:esterase/lipase superfamily enzyme